MPQASFEDAAKDYYQKKDGYVALLEAALDEKIAKEAGESGSSNESTAARTPLERKHPNPVFSREPELPKISVPTEDTSSLDIAKALEMVRDMRAWASKSKDKKVKEMLAKMDRELGAHSVPKE